MEVIANYQRVGNLLQELVNLYNQTSNLCRGLNNLPMYKIVVWDKMNTTEVPISFSGQMEVIRIFLKSIAGETTEQEDDFLDSMGIQTA